MADNRGESQDTDSDTNLPDSTDFTGGQTDPETIPAGDTVGARNTISGVGRLGENFGRYRIVRQLAQGGMGAVYLAEDPVLDRQLAIKVPVLSDGTVLDRFHREARAAAALQHPNICPIHEVSEVDGLHYIAMAYIEGKPLSEVVRPGKQLPLRDVVKFIRKVARALEHAHEKGVIHRDLKPANIIMNTRNEPVILDFGLARREGSSDTKLTVSGQTFGTLFYMPPEQADGDVEAMGPACDIYSLGVLLYQLLTGRVPFQGSVMAVLSQIANQEPEAPSSFRSEIDQRLDAICLKAMAKKPADRHASMSDFVGALSDYLDGRAKQAVVAGKTETEEVFSSLALVRATERYRIVKFMLIAVSVFFMIVLGAFFWPTPLPEARDDVPPASGESAPPEPAPVAPDGDDPPPEEAPPEAAPEAPQAAAEQTAEAEADAGQ